MRDTERLLKELLHPDTEFTPIPFWFFNDAFEEGKVRAQLEDYVEKGVYGLVLHPRIGVPEDMPYLSDTWFRAVRYIVRTASELGMKIVLYDEGMYPSGSAHGMVAAANPAYASRGILLMKEEEAAAKLAGEESAQVIAAFPDGRQIVYGFTGGTIRGIHFGEDDGEPGAPKAADILNPDAVELFIRLTHDRYYEELKEYFGNTVIAFFTDEPSALGRGAEHYRPWVPGLEKELEAAGGNVKDLALLFSNTGRRVAGREDIVEPEDNFTVRVYQRLIKEKLREIFYARLSRWCGEHGISLMGHPAESNDIEEELYFHIPGQDLIMRRVAPETGGLREFDSVQAKLSADIARHLGRRRNANECFGVCCRGGIPWYMTAGDMKWYIDWLGLRGVNLYVPHAFYYSLEGARKGERPPDVGPGNIWWKHYRRFSDYMKRLSFLMTDSVNGAEIAVLCDNNRVPYEEIACLYENQIEFNYLPAALLEKARIEGGKVWIGGYGYAGVVNVLGEAYEGRFREKLGDLLWTIPVNGADAVKKDTVKEFVCKMQDSACRGSESEGLAGVPGDGAAECMEETGGAAETEETAEIERATETEETAEIERAAETEETAETEEMASCGAKPRMKVRFSQTCKSLRLVTLRKYGTDMLLLGNEGSGAVRVDVTVPGMKSPLFFDLWRGTCYQVEGAAETFPVWLRPSETVLVMEGGEPGNLPGQVLAAGSDPGKSERDKIVECRKPDWYLAEYPDWTDRFALLEKSGNTAVYSMQYPAAEDWETVRFSVRAEEMVECYRNGSFVDVSFWGQHRFEVKELRKGENEIRLVITGNAANIYENAGIAFGLTGRLT
ncbi:MAG TPA: hypothetical protein DCZ91_11055 [Lachnospiraceae bacterium]|nr:hypothetical protein [Lachnospiraceae bacterium]